MGIFSFGRRGRRDAAGVPKDFRAERRRIVKDGWPSWVADYDGETQPLYDMSQNGFSMLVDEAVAPDKAVFILRRGDVVHRKVMAMRAWGTQERTGYRIADAIGIVEDKDADSKALLEERMRRRIRRAEHQAKRVEADVAARRAAREELKTAVDSARAQINGASSDRVTASDARKRLGL